MKTNSPATRNKSSESPNSVSSKPASSWAFPAIIFIVTWVIFLPVLRNEFVDWDDVFNLVNNPHYRGLGWNQLRWMFTTFHLGPYQPLSWMTYGLDYLIWGMNPTGYHLTNLILHAANGVFLYFVSRRLLAAAFSISDSGSWQLDASAAFAALFFAIHPLRVESVAWATERRDVLSGFFYLGTIYFYVRAGLNRESKQRWRWLGFALIAYGLSLLSKATSITLPVVLILLDFFPLRRLALSPKTWLSPPYRNVLYEKLPFFILAIVFAVIALLGQHAAGALQNYETILRVAQALYALCFYLWKTVVPIHLSPVYELPIDFSQWIWVFVIGVTGAIAIGIIFYFFRRPALIVSWLYYVIVLLPVSGIVAIGPQLVADRYSYLACLSWALVAGGGFLLALTLVSRKKRGLLSAKFVWGVAAAILVVLGTLTWRQTKVWRDSRTLWEYVMAVEPASSIAADALGKLSEAEGKEDQALEFYRRAVSINRVNAGAQFNLAKLLARKGQLQDAMVHYRAALLSDPQDAQAHNNLGLLLAVQGETTEALEHLYKAIEIDPGNARAFFNLARVFAKQGQLEKAAQNYRQALKLDPDQFEIHVGLGTVLQKQGHLAEAKERLETAVKLKPDFVGAHVALAELLLALGAKEQAESHYLEAVRLSKAQAKIPQTSQ